jgi:hypothetical protein
LLYQLPPASERDEMADHLLRKRRPLSIPALRSSIPVRRSTTARRAVETQPPVRAASAVAHALRASYNNNEKNGKLLIALD